MSTTISQVEMAPAETKVDPVAPRKGNLADWNLPLADWLFRSSAASWIWLVARCWLGYQWFNAGYQKIWGSEKMVFWYGGGGGVYGFAKSGVTANPLLWAPSATAGGQRSCTTSSCRTHPGSRS